VRILNHAAAGKMGLDANVIMISIAAAIGHGILEMTFLNLESKACKTNFAHYFSICFTGRLGWVPFTNKFDSATSGTVVDLKDVLDYDNMSSSLCGAKMSVQYEFTDQTIQVFIKSISCLPIENDEKKRMNVKFGKSISRIDFGLFCNVVAISHKRINLQLE